MDEIELTADRLAPGQTGRIIEVNAADPLRRRLQALGLIPGTLLLRRYAAPAGSPIAFESGGTVLALRALDASKIVVWETDAPWIV